MKRLMLAVIGALALSSAVGADEQLTRYTYTKANAPSKAEYVLHTNLVEVASKIANAAVAGASSEINKTIQDLTDFSQGVSNALVKATTDLSGYTTGVSNKVENVSEFSVGVSNSVDALSIHVNNVSTRVDRVVSDAINYTTAISNKVEALVTNDLTVAGKAADAATVGSRLSSAINYTTAVSNKLTGAVNSANQYTTGVSNKVETFITDTQDALLKKTAFTDVAKPSWFDDVTGDGGNFYSGIRGVRGPVSDLVVNGSNIAEARVLCIEGGAPTDPVIAVLTGYNGTSATALGESIKTVIPDTRRYVTFTFKTPVYVDITRFIQIGIEFKSATTGNVVGLKLAGPGGSIPDYGCKTSAGWVSPSVAIAMYYVIPFYEIDREMDRKVRNVIDADVLPTGVIGSKIASSTTLASDLKTTVAVGNVDANYTFAAGTSFEDILKEILAKDRNPTITQPSITNLKITNSTLAYEVGTYVTPTYAFTANTGSYQYGTTENGASRTTTGVTYSKYDITAGGTTVERNSTAGNLTAFTVTDNTSYKITQVVGTHSAGLVPLTYNGSKYPAGQISSGTKTYSTASPQTITGYRKYFILLGGELPTTIDSTYIRNNATLSGNAKDDLSSLAVTIASANVTSIVVAVPAGTGYTKTLKRVENGGTHYDEFANFVEADTIGVDGATSGHDSMDYKVYIWERKDGTKFNMIDYILTIN